MSYVRADERSVRQLLQGRKYGIDEYQREYKWDSKNITELLDDLHGRFIDSYDPGHERTEVEHYRGYFLGSIILSQRNGRDYIVDGQQRLTSLTLLLIYLRHLQGECNVENATKLDDFICSMKYGRLSFNLDVLERERCLEALYTTGEPYDPADDSDESVRNMLARYADIQEQFPDDLKGRALPYFVDWLLEKVELVEIATDSDDDAYIIFETMNDRGKTLTPTDMLKGYLLSQVPDPSERTELSQIWKKRMLEIAAFGREEGADFIKHWLRAKYAQSIRERKRGAVPRDFDIIGKAFHKWVRDNRDTIGLRTSADFRRFTRELFPRYVSKYTCIRQAEETLTKGWEAVFYNAHNNFTLQYPLLMSPIAPEDDQETAARKMRVVATYIDIFIARRVVNYMSVNYSTIVYTMFILMKELRSRTISELVAFLKARLADMDADFSGAPDRDRLGVPDLRLNQWSKRYIRNILARLTAYVEVQCGMPNHFPEYISRDIGKPYEIEHIWADKYERHTDEFDSPDEFQRVRNQIGGLILLPRGFNQSFGDLSYAEKRKHYVPPTSWRDRCTRIATTTTLPSSTSFRLPVSPSSTVPSSSGPTLRHDKRSTSNSVSWFGAPTG